MSSMASTRDCGVGTQTTSLPAWPTSGAYSGAVDVEVCAQALPIRAATASVAPSVCRNAIIQWSPYLYWGALSQRRAHHQSDVALRVAAPVAPSCITASPASVL